ncbi:PH domain-containing protein [Microbacterium radiodurans]|uniref:PH domain-containing protein n=1 Tax=Microbacterium radiodurans TaxID=661398 RepID=A0A5J5IQG3_9MICO|nr:PH domain-containing protein [Microbacterium radiodurans]KAA9086665.1 PH domain-containing protein [Microbacterium radiodurans]
MRKTYRPASATVVVVGSGLLAVFLLGDVFIRGGVAQGLRLTPWVALVVWAIYATLFAPSVAVDERAIVIANPLRVTRAPWPAVTDVRLRWQIVVDTTDGRSVSAFGGPSPGRPARPLRGARRSEVDEAARTPASVREAEEIRETWRANVDAPGETSVTTSWNRQVLIPFAVIAAGIALTLILG